MWRERAAAAVLPFAAAALLRAAIGLYGVIVYAVGQRTREFGIGVALGATKGDVLGLVLRRGLLFTCIGIVAGVAGSRALMAGSRVIASKGSRRSRSWRRLSKGRCS